MQKIIIENTEIAYTDYGSGTPLVFIHGFAEDHSIWSKLIPAFEKTNRVICIDIPGSGKSGPIDADTTIDSLADTIHLFLMKLEPGKCLILGHSMGGYIALALLEKYPQIFSGIGLIHSTSYADDDIKKQTREKAIAFIDKNGARLFLETAIPDLYADHSKHANDIRQHIEAGVACNDLHLQYYYRAMMQRPDRSEVLRSSEIPVLFVCGKHDKAVPLEQSLKQTYLANETHVLLLKHSAHLGMIEETNQLAQAIEKFIQHTAT